MTLEGVSSVSVTELQKRQEAPQDGSGSPEGSELQLDMHSGPSGQSSVAYASLKRSDARPTGLHIPDAARMITPGSHPAPWSQMAESHALNDEAASLVGVSIGREQTRMNSPTTPAAEKSAALDRTNSWGFFDNSAEEQEQLAGIKEDEREAEAFAERDRKTQLPGALSPVSSSPRVHDAVKDRNRSRAGSLFNATLPDLNVKQLWQSFNASSLTDALHKLTPLGSGKDGQPIEKRSSRSNSLFAHRMTWSGLGRRDGASSPRRGTMPGHASTQNTPTLRSSPFGSRPESNETTPGSMSPTRRPTITNRTTDELVVMGASRQPTQYESIVASRATKGDRNMRPGLRRVASDGSMLSRTSTKYSFDADNAQFANIDTMVNSRFKAVKDSWQDSAFRFKNVTSNRRISLMPDFFRSSDDSGQSISKTLTGFFSDNNVAQEAKSEREEPSSPPKLSRHPTLDAALENLTGDVVLMGGYRGSILRSAEPPHRQVWVPIKVGLNVRKVNLEVGLEPEDEETEHERIFSSGILSHIGPIDISRRLIRRIRSSPNARNGSLRFHDYGYDWRLSPEFLGRRLIRFLEQLPCNQPSVHPSKRGATVIAHSLGGLITRWAVNQRPELFAGVVFAGTPQYCVNILGPFRNGDDVLLSSRVLTAQVNFTLRTSYALLPETGRCFVDKDTEEEYRVDFFDAQQWEEYRWSPCVGYPLPIPDTRPNRSNSILATLRDSVPSLPSLTSRSNGNLLSHETSNGSKRTNGSTSPSGDSEQPTVEQNPTSPLRAAEEAIDRKVEALAHPDENTVEPSMQNSPPMSGPAGSSVATAVTIPHETAMKYLRRTLDDTLRFKRALSHRVEHEESNAYPPLSVLYATCVPTVYGAKVSGREGIKRADAYDNLVFAAGDGVVLARASMLPRGYSVCQGGRIRTDRGHVGLLGDLESVGKCIDAVIKARRKGVGLGAESVVAKKL